MDNFYIPVSSGLLDPKHSLLIDNSLGLFLFLLDRTTKEKNGEVSREGLVLGGKPISCEEIAQVLGSNRQRVRRYKVQLERDGYIRTALTTAHGKPRWWVLKSKKWDTTDVQPVNNVDVQKQNNGCSDMNIGGIKNEHPIRQHKETTQRDRSLTDLKSGSIGTEAGLPTVEGNVHPVNNATNVHPVNNATALLFSNPLQPMVEKYGQALVDAVKAHSKADPFWKLHTNSAVANTWDTRLEQYQTSLRKATVTVKPINLPGRGATQDMSYIKVSEI